MNLNQSFNIILNATNFHTIFQVVVQQALAGLKQLMVQPRLVPGAGCFESWLATKLREEVRPILCTAL